MVRMMVRKYVLVCIVVFMAFMGHAQKPEPVLRHFTTLNGLPSSQIYQVIKDNLGYLWFATDHGIARFNGYEFKVFSSAEGLLDNTVFKLFQDSKNRIWMQTFSGQFFYVENEKVYPYKFNEVPKRIVGNFIPLNFFVDSLEQVYFSCNYRGEYRIDTTGKPHIEVSFGKNISYNQVFVDEVQKGHYLTSGNRLFNPSLSTYLFFREHNGSYDSVYVESKYSGQIFACKMSDGRLLVSMADYLFELKNKKLSLLTQLPGRINYLFEGLSGQLWASTYKGLYQLSLKSMKVERVFLENEFVSCTTLDHEGGLWIATVNNGVYYYIDPGVSEYVFNTDSLKEPLCLTRGEDCIYAGFWNGAIARITGSGYTCIPLPTNGNYISAIYNDKEHNRLLISSQPSGYIYNGKFTTFKNDGTKSLKGEFVRRRSGELINASINGLYKLENDSFFVWAGLKQRANCIIEKSDSGFLIGTNAGVFVINESAEVQGLFHPVFKDVRVDDAERIDDLYFFASRGKGLVVVVGDSAYSIDETKGLCSNIIHNITRSKNTIWCASYNGASCVTIISQKPFKYSVSRIGYNEGLPDNEINDLAVLNDTVWVATKKSISFFDSRLNYLNIIPPLVHFTNLKVNNVEVPFKESFSLGYNSNNISIGFEALSFKSYGQLRYRYWLVNEADTFESVTASRHVEFLSLKPGQYTFSVMGMNSSGTWSEKPESFRFTILTPFWLQWWFRIVVTLFFLALAIVIVRMRIARIREQERLRTDFNKQLVLLEMKALRAQMNPHFIFNVMNSIQDYILKNDARSAQRYLTKFAKLVRSILDNSVEGEVMLEEELKANELYVELEQQRFEEKFAFVLDVAADVDSNSLLIPSMIIQPFLENAIKHGIRHLKGTGKLLLKVTRDDDTVFILIEDNGIGRRAAAEINKMNANDHISYGSLITSRRVEAYNNAHNTSIQLVVTDLYDLYGKPAGTRVELLIPVKYRMQGASASS